MRFHGTFRSDDALLDVNVTDDGIVNVAATGDMTVQEFAELAHVVLKASNLATHSNVGLANDSDRGSINVEVMTWQQKAVNEQIIWIDLCGGNLEGYIERNGDPGVTEEWHGDGGTAIYEADMAELHQLQERLLEKQQRRT